MQPFVMRLSYLFLGLGALGLIAGVLDAMLTTIGERRFIWRHPDLEAGALLSSLDRESRLETIGQVERGIGLGCFSLVLLYVGGFLWQVPTRWSLMSVFQQVARYLLELCLPYSLILGGAFLGILWVENCILDLIEAQKFGGLWRSRAAGKRPGEQRIEMGFIVLLSLALGGLLLWLLR
jgi:hypothetical protein